MDQCLVPRVFQAYSPCVDKVTVGMVEVVNCNAVPQLYRCRQSQCLRMIDPKRKTILVLIWYE